MLKYVIAILFIFQSHIIFSKTIKVGMSWAGRIDNGEERWKTDEEWIISTLKKNRASYIGRNAELNIEKQIQDLKELVEKEKVDVLMVLAIDGLRIAPMLSDIINGKIGSKKVPVILYDRGSPVKGAYYISFDNKEVGVIQAQAVYKTSPKGNYVLIKGSQTDSNTKFLEDGQKEVLKKAINKGDLKIYAEVYTENWSPEVAQKNLADIITRAQKEGVNIDAVVASNDGTAGGAFQAMQAANMKIIPLSGQDGDHSALNRIARGQQTVTAFKDSRKLASGAAYLAIDLAENRKLNAIEQVIAGVKMPTIYLKPTSITKRNLDYLVRSDWITKEKLCQNVTDPKLQICN